MSGEWCETEEDSTSIMGARAEKPQRGVEAGTETGKRRHGDGMGYRGQGEWCQTTPPLERQQGQGDKDRGDIERGDGEQGYLYCFIL